MGRWRSRLKGPKSRGYFVRRAILFIVVGQVLIAAEGRHFDDMRLAFVVFLHVPVVMIYVFAYRVLNRWGEAEAKSYAHLLHWPLALMVLWGVTELDWNPGRNVRVVRPYQSWQVATETKARVAYDFAHSLQLPDPYVDDGFYKKGFLGVIGRTTREEYIKHLCENVAGEFIYKTVENVAGVLELRPRKRARQTEDFYHRYNMEDPFGYDYHEVGRPYSQYAKQEGFRYFESTIGRDRAPFLLGWPSGLQSQRFQRRYSLIDVPGRSSSPYWRYEYLREIGRHPVLTTTDGFRAVPADSPRSRFAYTWRGMRVPYDRENTIAGGELIVVDLSKNEVLGVKRGFAVAKRISNNRTGLDWEFAYKCPWPDTDKRRPISYDFVSKVLKPINQGVVDERNTDMAR